MRIFTLYSPRCFNAESPTVRGFGMVETFAALGIFTIGLVIAMGSQLNASRGLKLSIQTTLATNLATAQLEELLVTDDNLLRASGQSLPSYYDRRGERLSTRNRRARFMVLWQSVPSPSGYYFDLTVRTYWRRDFKVPDGDVDDPEWRRLTVRGRALRR